MYHHAESPEVIHAKLAEWERTVAAHRLQVEAERLLAGSTETRRPQPAQSLIARLRHLLRPATHMRQQPGG
jgi:hypothetical protein